MSAVLRDVLTHLAALTVGIAIEPIRLWLFRPRLRVLFTEKDCRVNTPATIGRAEYPTEAWFVRIRVENMSWTRSIARQCRGYLISLEKLGLSDGERLRFIDSIPMAWSYRHQSAEAIDLPRGLPAFLDVLHTAEEGQGRFYFRFAVPEPLRYLRLHEKTDAFVLTILLAAENAAPKRIALEFKWKGDWEDFEVREVSAEPARGCRTTKRVLLAFAQQVRVSWKRLRGYLKRLP